MQACKQLYQQDSTSTISVEVNQEGVLCRSKLPESMDLLSFSYSLQTSLRCCTYLLGSKQVFCILVVFERKLRAD